MRGAPAMRRTLAISPMGTIGAVPRTQGAGLPVAFRSAAKKVIVAPISAVKGPVRGRNAVRQALTAIVPARRDAVLTQKAIAAPTASAALRTTDAAAKN